MYVCDTCTVLHVNGDYSGTGMDDAMAEEIAENLSGMVILIEDDPRFTMDYCSGCGVHGGDMYRACYYDELVTN